MKLLTEINTQIETLTENTSEGKNMYLEGIFLQSNIVNRNKRNYPKPVMEQAVDRFKNEFMANNKAFGEINHPDYPLPDPAKVAMKITELHWDGNNVYGKAKIMNNFYGMQLKSLIEDKFPLGVSSRGLGDVKNGVVNKFLLNAIDAVDNPSGPNCYVHGINESTQEWVEENGIWVLKESVRQFNETEFLNVWDKYLETLKKNRK